MQKLDRWNCCDHPIIIAFEGLDCTYKETNSKALYDHLRKYLSEDQVKLVHFPNYDSQSSYFVREYLHEKYDNSDVFMSDMSKKKKLKIIANFYLLDMFDWWSKLDKKTVKVVIIDRWFYSMMYYLTKSINKHTPDPNKRVSYASTIYKMATEMYKLPMADIVFRMENDIGTVLEKTVERAKEEDTVLDKYEKDDLYMLKVKETFNYLNIYKYMTDSFGNTVYNVNVSNKSKEELAACICEKVDGVLCLMENELLP